MIQRINFPFSLIAVILMFILGCDGNSTNPFAPQHSGPTATEVFTQYPSNVWHGIAGNDEQIIQSIEGMTPGFLAMLEISIPAGRTGARQIDFYSSTDTLGYVFQNGWYQRSIDSSGFQGTYRWRLSPNPFRNEGTPTTSEQEVSLSYTESLANTRYTIATFIHNHKNGTLFDGYWDNTTTMTINIPVIGQRSFTQRSPFFWEGLDNTRDGLNNYTNKRGHFNASGTASLGTNQTTEDLIPYQYTGHFTISPSTVAGDSVGFLYVGGQLFATYFYQSFRPLTGLYDGFYRFSNSDTTRHPFIMQ